MMYTALKRNQNTIASQGAFIRKKSRKLNMNIANRTVNEQAVSTMAPSEIAALLETTTSKITDWLREQHEVALRRPARTPRMRSVNATPV